MSEPRVLASRIYGGTCKACGERSHVRTRQIIEGLECVRNYIPLCRKCYHKPIEEILTSEEVTSLELLRDVFGGL